MNKSKKVAAAAGVVFVAIFMVANTHAEKAPIQGDELKLTAGTTSGGRPPPKLKTAWEKFKELYSSSSSSNV